MKRIAALFALLASSALAYGQAQPMVPVNFSGVPMLTGIGTGSSINYSAVPEVILVCPTGSSLVAPYTLCNLSGGGGSGTITGVTAGTGVTGGGTTGIVTVNVDTTKIAPLTAVSSLPTTTYSIVPVGDSRCAGAAIPGAPAWPAILQTLPPVSTQSTGTTNKCVAGNTLTNMISTYTSSGTKALCQAATSTNPVLMPIMDGINDFAAGLSAETVYQLYLQYAAQAKADGCTPIAMTDLPAINAVAGVSANHARFNTLIRSCPMIPGGTITSCPWSRVLDVDALAINPLDHSLMNGVITAVAVSGCATGGCSGYVNGDVVNVNSYGAQGGTCTIGGVVSGVPATCTLAAGGIGYNPDILNLTTTDVTHPAATGMLANIFASYDGTHQSPLGNLLIAANIARWFGGSQASQANATSIQYPNISPTTGGFQNGDLFSPTGVIRLNPAGTAGFFSSGSSELLQTTANFGVVLGDAGGADSFSIYSSAPASVFSVNSVGTIATGAKAVTQSAGDTSTQLATDQFASAAAVSAPQQIQSSCSGALTNTGLAISWMQLGGGAASCTGGPTSGEGVLMAVSGFVTSIGIRCAVTGSGSTSGVLTLYDQTTGATTGAATALTVTHGTQTANTLYTSTGSPVAFAAGDILSLRASFPSSPDALSTCSVIMTYHH